uniref:Uncharacterized protein n=1 Tax=Arundo donax TaxID=35708 RepID=A0A0A9BSD5_ARUDO
MNSPQSLLSSATSNSLTNFFLNPCSTSICLEVQFRISALQLDHD